MRCVLVCHIGSNLSGVYRMQLAPGHYVFVQTKSKLFKNSASGHPEFIMSTHSIVRSDLLQLLRRVLPSSVSVNNELLVV